MVLVEKSLSQLLRIAFPYTCSEPPIVSPRLLRAVEALRAGAGHVGHCWSTLHLPEKGQKQQGVESAL